MIFLQMITFWGTGKTKYGLKFDSPKVLTGMTKYHNIAVKCMHCVRDNDFVTDYPQNNVLEAFKTGTGRNECLGFCAAKTINIPNTPFFLAKKSISNRNLDASRLRL